MRIVREVLFLLVWIKQPQSPFRLAKAYEEVEGARESRSEFEHWII